MWRSLIFISWLLTVSVFGMELELKESTGVIDGKIRLADVIVGGVDVPDQLWGVELCDAPSLGQERYIDRGFIENALQSSGIGWAGAQTCRVERPARLVNEGELRHIIYSELKKHTGGVGKVKIFEISRNASFYVPQGPLQIHAKLSRSSLRSSWGSVALRYTLNGRTLLVRSVRFRWGWERPVWQANTSLAAGKIINTTDFSPMLCNVLELKPGVYMGNLEEEDAVLARKLQPGEVLNESCVRPRTIVRRGDPVLVHYRNGSVTVDLKAKALENGSRGDLVAIRNENSKKRVFARVIDEGVLAYEN